MLQVVPKTMFALGYNTLGLNQWSGILDGHGTLTDTSIDMSSPMIVAGSVESLTVMDLSGLRLDTTVTIYVNGVATALTVFLPAGVAGRQVTISASVPFAVGDVVQYNFHNSTLLPPFGDAIAASVNLQVPEQIFSIHRDTGFPSGLMIGGTFGNGIMQEWPGSPLTNMG